MGSAYVVGHVLVKNQDLWDKYRSLVPETFKKFGGEVLFRGEKKQSLAGNDLVENQLVVIKFPDIQSINSWYLSGEYQDLVLLRDQAAQVTLTSYIE
jgi:uncharacterized protein (DUF1330 family)